MNDRRMSDLLEKCEICQGLIDEEDLFCANCGAEAPHRQRTAPADHAGLSTHNFQCAGCGASMSYDASARTLRCPFCGSGKLEAQNDASALAARRVAPFEVDRQRAESILRKWLGNGFWRPGDLATAAMLTKMTPVYVPYWVFCATTYTYWTADSSQTPLGARGDWFPLAGEHHGRYEGLLVGASSVLTPQETWSICPFDLSRAVAPDNVDLENSVVEQFRVQRKYARPQARQGLEAMERDACQKYVPGRCRNMKVNVRLEGLSSEPVLVPVWVAAYRYKGSVYRFLLNGQTGKASGEAPISWRKIVGLIAVVLLVIVGLLLGSTLIGILAG